MKKKMFLVISFIVLALALGVSTVSADPPGGCPQDGDWVKVDGLSSLSYMYTAPAGKVVAESCYKAGSHDPVYETYDPAKSPVTVTSGLFNSPSGVTCTAPGVPVAGCSYQNLSHASFRLVDQVTPPPTRDRFNLTSMCRPSVTEGSFRVRNQSSTAYNYTLKLNASSVVYSGTVAANTDLLITVPWSNSSETWILTVDPGGLNYTYTKAVGANALCTPEYETCSVQNTVYGPWSDWMSVEGNLLREYRTREVSIVDSQNSNTPCGDTTTETEYRDVGFCVAYPDDSSCIPCSVEGKENLMSDDPECVIPPKEKKTWTPPLVNCPDCPAIVLGNEDWHDYVQPGQQNLILFATAQSQCYKAVGYNPGSADHMPFYYEYLVFPPWIGEFIGGAPFSVVYTIDWTINPAVQDPSGYWVLQVPNDTDFILIDGTHAGSFSYDMLEENGGTLKRLLDAGWTYQGFNSASGALPF